MGRSAHDLCDLSAGMGFGDYTAPAPGDLEPDRIYLTGESNGAMLTNHIMPRHGNRFAAAAGVVMTVFVDAAPIAHPTPIRLMDQPMIGAVRSARFWVAPNGANPVPERTVDGEDYHEWYAGGENGEEVLIVSLAEGGHIWPAEAYNATDEIWSFFERY